VEEAGRILGVDPGERRVGLAVSDPLGLIAQGLPTFDRREDGDLFERLRELIESYRVTRVVVGHPTSLAGRRTDSTAQAEGLADEIRRRLAVDVELWDERLSSVEAQRTLAGARPDKKRIDRLAAVIILQGYLDAHPRAAS
jgi:putative Holliday junction resolvase